jgi:hypothetical protein
MSNQEKLRKRITNLRKAARILSVIIISFAAFIFIGEIMFPHAEEEYPPIENLMPFFLLLSVASLGLAWRRELLGGVLNISFFAANYILYWIIRGRPFPLYAIAILSLVIVPGILYIVAWAQSRKVVVTEI